ncbi:MAG TPA: TIGR01906 family membrane protein [Eubacteriales bacterium]|nr:TIGR01906 family membrane protein [Eubacteriales bacterium]
MKKVLSVGMATVASILLILILVFTSIGLVINDETFINNEFTKLSISEEMGISNSDLVRAMTQLVDYMEGDADDISVEVTLDGEQVEMFDYPQEAEHMADVRQIYTTIASYRDMGVLVMLILFLFAAVVDFRKAPQRLAQGYLSGSFVMLLIFGFLGTWAALDFSNFWTFFHQALFWNDLWLFDATESRMINMLPEDFFADTVGRIGLYAGAVIVALIVLSILALALSSDAHKRRRAIAQARGKARKDASESRKKAKQQAKEEAEEQKRLAEEQKRLEEKKARIAAARAKKQQRLETERKAAEQERLTQERREKKHAGTHAETAAQRNAPSARQAAKAPAQKRSAAQKSAAHQKTKQKKENIADDTGFLDD